MRCPSAAGRPLLCTCWLPADTSHICPSTAQLVPQGGLAPASLVPEGLGCRPLELSFFLRQARALRPGTSTGYLPRARAPISLAPCSTWHLQEAASSVLKTVTLGEAGLLFEKRSQRTHSGIFPRPSPFLSLHRLHLPSASLTANE